jgi:hypothetical protein
MDSSLKLPQTKANVFKFPFLRTARTINRFSAGTVALTVLIKFSRAFPVNALETAISSYQNPEIASINLEAMRAGSRLY